MIDSMYTSSKVMFLKKDCLSINLISLHLNWKEACFSDKDHVYCKLAYLSFHNQYKYCPVVNSATVDYSAFWCNCICGRQSLHAYIYIFKMCWRHSNKFELSKLIFLHTLLDNWQLTVTLLNISFWGKKNLWSTDPKTSFWGRTDPNTHGASQKLKHPKGQSYCLGRQQLEWNQKNQEAHLVEDSQSGLREPPGAVERSYPLSVDNSKSKKGNSFLFI